jgi:hypothetical protein
MNICARSTDSAEARDNVANVAASVMPRPNSVFPPPKVRNLVKFPGVHHGRGCRQRQSNGQRRILGHGQQLHFDLHLRPQPGKVREKLPRRDHLARDIADHYQPSQRVHLRAPEFQHLLDPCEQFLRLLRRHSLRDRDGGFHHRSAVRTPLLRVPGDHRRVFRDWQDQGVGRGFQRAESLFHGHLSGPE